MTQLLNPGRSSGASKRTELAALNEIIRKLIRLSSSFTAGVGTATLAEQQTQTTALNSILNNIAASKDIEYLSVRDTVTGTVYQQIREYDEGTGTFVTRYEDVNGAPFVPVNPMIYLDPSAVLNLILAAVTNKSDLYKMQTEANDLVETYTYLDPGNPTDRRISTIVYSSVALALSVTETFAYAGGAGDYYVTSSTLS